MRRFLGILLVVLALRSVLLIVTGIHPPPITALWADLLTAAFLYAITPLLPGLFLRAGAVALIATGYAAGAEHLVTHGTYFRIGHLGHLTDPGFVGSSVNGLSILWFAVFAIISSPLLWLLKCNNNPPLERTLGVLAGVFVMQMLTMPTLTTPSNNVVVGSLGQVPPLVVRRSLPLEQDEASPQEEKFYEASPRASHPPGAQQNVLLVMIEGLSGGYFPGVARHHGIEPAVQLAELESVLDERGFRIYRNTLAPQRQTDRGSYALLCADHPRMRLLRSEMRESPTLEGEFDCLPHRLNKAGYKTAYLQAADLEFMEKDQFMPMAGFQRTVGGLGAPEDPEDTRQSGWGANDQRFFDAALPELQRLDNQEQPWFATLLNVGTHHPYLNSPKQVDSARAASAQRPKERMERRQEAFTLMGKALTAFIRKLDHQGLLETTTVIVTSDESDGIVRQAPEPAPLDGNFGVIAIRPADRTSSELRWRDRDSLTSAIDLPKTVLDLTGGAPGEKMIGRSLLNPDAQNRRHLIVGDTYAKRVHFIRSDGKAIGCNEAALSCTSFEFQPSRLFGTLKPSEHPPFMPLRDRVAVIQRTDEIRALRETR